VNPTIAAVLQILVLLLALALVCATPRLTSPCAYARRSCRTGAFSCASSTTVPGSERLTGSAC
jgi:hypothetical protein